MTNKTRRELEQLYQLLMHKVVESLSETGINHKALLAIDRMLSIAKFIKDDEHEEMAEEHEEQSFGFSEDN